MKNEHDRVLKELESEIREKFSEPSAYKNFKIKYVNKPEKADVKVSRNHVLADYLAIGITCLRKELEGIKGHTVNVFNESKYSSFEMLSFYKRFMYDSVTINCQQMNALDELMVTKSVSVIIHAFYKEVLQLPVEPGIHICRHLQMLMLYHYDSECIEIPPCRMNVEALFENFDDTVRAQKLAYTTIRELLITFLLFNH